MTIVIALSCADGVLMASDSQSTELGAQVRWDVQKVFSLTDHAVFAGSGQTEIIGEIRQACEDSRPELEATPDIARSLVDLIHPILDKYYRKYIPIVPGKPQIGSAETGVLAAGFVPGGGPWILEIDPHCMPSHYEDRGFHAIGSAAGFAQMANALMKHFEVKEQPVTYGELVAYRTMRAAIDTPAFGVGGDIQMWRATADGTHEYSAEELRAIGDSVGGWEQVERDALNEFMRRDREEEAPPIPEEVAPDETEPAH